MNAPNEPFGAGAQKGRIDFLHSAAARRARHMDVLSDLFSTESNKAQGISAVKALAIASQQGHKMAGKLFCTAWLPEGRGTWMYRVSIFGQSPKVTLNWH